MPKLSEPRIVVRVSSEDHLKLQTASDVAGVGISTLLREAAIRHDHYREVAKQLAAEKTSGSGSTMAPPPADPVPQAAFTFKCPASCGRTFSSPMAICPEHGRRAVPA